MSKTIRKNLLWDEVLIQLQDMEVWLHNYADQIHKKIAVYGIPRGGIYIAALLKGSHMYLVEQPEDADVFVDDIIDSGKTKLFFECKYGKPVFALYNKLGGAKEFKNTWLSFPWERMTHDDGPVENVRRLIEYIGDDPTREGLKETPDRVIKSFEKLYGGYKQCPEEFIKVFEDDTCDDMVLVKDIEFYSTCEHHMLPFYGKAHIAYIPDGKVIGVSKLVRILEVYARRLQIQERLCQEVTTALDILLSPVGSACILEAQHFCMTARGVEKQNSIMVTSSLTGVFKDNDKTRSEFLNLKR